MGQDMPWDCTTYTNTSNICVGWKVAGSILRDLRVLSGDIVKGETAIERLYYLKNPQILAPSTDWLTCWYPTHSVFDTLG